MKYHETLLYKVPGRSSLAGLTPSSLLPPSLVRASRSVPRSGGTTGGGITPPTSAADFRRAEAQTSWVANPSNSAAGGSALLPKSDFNWTLLTKESDFLTNQLPLNMNPGALQRGQAQRSAQANRPSQAAPTMSADQAERKAAAAAAADEFPVNGTLEQQAAWMRRNAEKLMVGGGEQSSLAAKLWQDEVARSQAANNKFLADEAARLGIGKEDPNLRRAFETAIGDLRAREAAALPSIQLAFQAATDQANRAAGETLLEGRGLGSRLFSTYNTAAGAIDNSNALTNANFADLTGGTSAGVTYADANDFASLLRAQAPSAQAYAQGLGAVLANSRLADAQTSQIQSAAEQAAARNLATRLIAEQTVGYQEREAARQQQLNEYISSLRAQAFRDQQETIRRGNEAQIEIQREGLSSADKFVNEAVGALIGQQVKDARAGASATNGAGGLYAQNVAAIRSYGSTDIPYDYDKNGKPQRSLPGYLVDYALSNAETKATAMQQTAGSTPADVQRAFVNGLMEGVAVFGGEGSEHSPTEAYGLIIRHLGLNTGRG